MPEGVDHELVAEQGGTELGRDARRGAGAEDEDNGEPADGLVGAVAEEHAEHQQRHRAADQDELRQNQREVGQGAGHRPATVSPPDALSAAW